MWNQHLCEEVAFKTCGECIKIYVWFYNFLSPFFSSDCDFRVYRSLNPIENQQTNIYATDDCTCHFRGVQSNVCEIYIFVRKSYLTLVRNVSNFIVWFYNFLLSFLSSDRDIIVYRSLNPMENQQTDIYATDECTCHFRSMQSNVCEINIFVRKSHLSLVGNVSKLMFDFTIFYHLFSLRIVTSAYIVHWIQSKTNKLTFMLQTIAHVTSGSCIVMCVWNLHLCEEFVFNTCGECIKIYVRFCHLLSSFLSSDCDFRVYRSPNPIEN